MSTPLPDAYRKHVIEISGYDAGIVLRAIVNDKIADEATTWEVSDTPQKVYMVVEFNKPAHSKNRGVLVDCAPGDTINIIDRDKPNTVLHTVAYAYGTVTQFVKQ